MSADPLSFFLIWATPPHTFLPRFMRSVESIFRWHPAAHVDVLSNSLPSDFFSPLAAKGLDISIERYDLEALLAGTRAQVWYDFRHFWNRSSYFSNHEADLLRLLTLRRRGGVYVDTDVVFVRPVPQLASPAEGMLGIESGGGGARADGGADARAATVSLAIPWARICSIEIARHASATVISRQSFTLAMRSFVGS